MFVPLKRSMRTILRSVGQFVHQLDVPISGDSIHHQQRFMRYLKCSGFSRWIMIEKYLSEFVQNQSSAFYQWCELWFFCFCIWWKINGHRVTTSQWRFSHFLILFLFINFSDLINSVLLGVKCNILLWILFCCCV